MDAGLIEAVLRRGRDLAERHPRTVVAGAMLTSILAVYAPFLDSPDKLYRYWDGPLYMYVARTLYQVPADHPFALYNLPPAYFASHFPAYPLLIRALTWVTLGSYPLAMLLATVVTAVAAAVLFHEVLRRYELVPSPVWTAGLFAVIPPRWILYHSIGASEPLFLCALFAALLALRRDRPLPVALWLALACLTRVVGVVFVGAFGLLYLWRRQWLRAALMILPLAAVGALFAFHGHQFGDPLAAFRWNMAERGMMGDMPFAGLFSPGGLGNFRAAELYVILYVAYAYGTLQLRAHRDIFVPTLCYLVFATFLVDRDVTRFLLPIAPFALLVGLDDVLRSRAFRWLTPLVVVLGHAYAWRSLPENMMAMRVWRDLLPVLSQ